MFRHGYTYGGHPAAAAAGLANLAILERERCSSACASSSRCWRRPTRSASTGTPGRRGALGRTRRRRRVHARGAGRDAGSPTWSRSRARARPHLRADCAASPCRSRRRSSSPRTRSRRWPGACAWRSTTPCAFSPPLPERSAVRLNPREEDRLLLFLAAELARRRRGARPAAQPGRGDARSSPTRSARRRATGSATTRSSARGYARARRGRRARRRARARPAHRGRGALRRRHAR